MYAMACQADDENKKREENYDGAETWFLRKAINKDEWGGKEDEE